MKEKIVNYLLSKQWFLAIVIERFVNEIDDIDYNAHAEGCGLEDRDIRDRYEAMEHGWMSGVNAAMDAVKNAL